MAKRPSKSKQVYLPRIIKYWNKTKVKSKRRNVKRVPGKTKKFIKGTGTHVWVGKDVTQSGWMKKKKFDQLYKK